MAAHCVVYFGTPDYAEPTLTALASDIRFDVRLVVTQPDRAAGRGRAVRAPAVKNAALELGLPVYQPESLRKAEMRAPLEAAGADVFVVAAYGLIFGRRTLATPRLGCVNLHASLLPAYRGASSVAAAILSGDDETGVTLMRMEVGLDTGPLVANARASIESSDTTETLTRRLAMIGSNMAPDAIFAWAGGELTETPQPSKGATLVRPLIKADGWLDWQEPANRIERRLRAMTPWPLGWSTNRHGEHLQVLTGDVTSEGSDEPGTVRIVNREVLVACGHGSLRLKQVRVAGRKTLDAIALVNGRKIADGDVLGSNGAVEEPPPLIVPIPG